MPLPSSRVLLPHDIPAAAEVIARAYADDPLCAFMLPLRATRQATLRKFFRAYLGIASARCSVLLAGEPPCAVAVWNRPGAGPVSVSVRSLGAFVPLLATLYPWGLLRARAAVREQDTLRSRHAPARHAYLDNVAVDPRHRGQGLASALIRPVLLQADEEGTATYTDTFTASNVPLYEHFGFRCVAHTTEPRSGLSVWALLRAAP